MTEPNLGPDEVELTEEEMEKRLQAFQASQQLFLEQNFKWLIEYVGSYFPKDQLALRDMDLEVHFIHKVVEDGKELGALVYRFRKFTDKKEYFSHMAEEYREGLGLSEALFVDSETSKFQSSGKPGEDPYLEIPPDQLTGRIRELREALISRAKLRNLRESL